jgi:hypothetical protein
MYSSYVLLAAIALVHRIAEIVAHMVDAAALWRHYVIEAGEVAHGAIGVEAVIRHRLPAAGLVARVSDLMAEALWQFPKSRCQLPGRTRRCSKG